MSTQPRITPTVTPIAERHAADAAIERALGGVSEREALADIATHLQLSSDAQLRVGTVVGVGMSARQVKAAIVPMAIVAGEGLASAIAMVGRFVELARAARILAPEQVRTADEAGILLQQLLIGIVDTIGADATIPPGGPALEEVMRRRGEDMAAMAVGRIYLRMTAQLEKAARIESDALDLEAAFGGKAGR